MGIRNPNENKTDSLTLFFFKAGTYVRLNVKVKLL